MRITAPFPRTRDRAGNQVAASGRSWLLLPVALVLATGAVFWWLPSRLAPVQTLTTATVNQGSLTISVSGSGSVAAARTVAIPFQQSGTVTSVDVKVGDQVKTGQTLAKIDTGDLQLQLQQAQANLKSAQAKLDQVKTGTTTPQDLASAQASLESAKAQLEQTKTGTATKADIQSAEAQLVAAQAQLNALKNPSQADMDAAQNKITQAQSTLESTRNNDSQAKTNAQLQLQNAVNSLTQAQSKYATAKQNWEYVQSSGNDPSNPSTTTADGKKVENKLGDAQRQQYYDTYVQAEAALHTSENAVTQAQVGYDAARQKEALDIPQSEAAVRDAQVQLDALHNPTPSALAQAQAAVTQAQASLTKLRQGGTVAAIAQGQAAVTQAQANLDKLTAPATQPDIAAAEASLVQAQVQVDTAQRNLNQATLVAPFDGVVSAVAVQPGSISSPSTAAVTVVDRSKLHIDVNLSETDAAKVQPGQAVTLTFDAVPGASLNGTIATIAPAATVQQNVVTYPVQIEFDPGTSPVKVGMSASADILIQQINNATLVPSRAVQTTGTRRVVNVLQGPTNIPVPVQVEVGATSNGQVEILRCVDTGAQCLRPGDVLSITSSTTTTQQNQNGNNFGPRGGGPVIFPGGR